MTMLGVDPGSQALEPSSPVSPWAAGFPGEPANMQLVNAGTRVTRALLGNHLICAICLHIEPPADSNTEVLARPRV